MSRLKHPLPGICRWSIYSPDHHVELSSHAVVESGRLVLFDPILLAPELWSELNPEALPTAIVITNANHCRSSAAWRDRLNCPIYAPAGIDLEIAGAQRFLPPDCPLPGWNTFSLFGAAPGETAFWLPTRSLVVFGDAVVNLPQRGLELLPDKYCTSPALLRSNLPNLVARGFKHALFAHGEPLLESAATRISALL